MNSNIDLYFEYATSEYSDLIEGANCFLKREEFSDTYTNYILFFKDDIYDKVYLKIGAGCYELSALDVVNKWIVELGKNLTSNTQNAQEIEGLLKKFELLKKSLE